MLPEMAGRPLGWRTGESPVWVCGWGVPPPATLQWVPLLHPPPGFPIPARRPCRPPLTSTASKVVAVVLSSTSRSPSREKAAGQMDGNLKGLPLPRPPRPRPPRPPPPPRRALGRTARLGRPPLRGALVAGGGGGAGRAAGWVGRAVVAHGPARRSVGGGRPLRCAVQKWGKKCVLAHFNFPQKDIHHAT